MIKVKCTRVSEEEASLNIILASNITKVPAKPGFAAMDMAETGIEIKTIDKKIIALLQGLKPGKEYTLTIK